MRSIIYFVLGSITFCTSVKGQNESSYPALRIGANFFSESFLMSDGAAEGEDDFNSFFNNNGWNIETKYTVLCHQSKEKEGRKLRGSEVLNLGINGYFYGIQNQSNNTIVTVDLGIEKEFFFGLQLFGKFGVGILNTKLVADVYSVDANGNVSQNNGLASTETVLPASLGLGYNFQSLTNIPVIIKARTMHFSKSYGNFSTYKAGLLLGIEYRFKNLNISPIKEF